MNKAEVEKKKHVTLVSQDMFSNWFVRALLATLCSVKFGGNCNFEVVFIKSQITQIYGGFV
jgi:hypothetical protein